MNIKALWILLLLVGGIISNTSATDFYPKKTQIGIYEHLDTIVSENIYLINSDSSRVQLKSLINKPTVFCFIYFNCPGLCSPLLGGLADVIEKTDMKLGQDYQVITISMNSDDYPSLGKRKKANYVKTFKKKIDTSAWIWLTGDSLNIARITDNLGFKFKREGDDFVHTAALIVTSPEGKVTRYLHGTYFLPFDLKMALVEASRGISGPTINKVLQFCFSYDPGGKKYVFNITKIAGGIIILLAVIMFLVLALKKRK